MEKTVAWFKDVLGWFGGVVARDEAGKAIYGCVFDYPDEVAIAKVTPFRGFHLFSGEPHKGVIGFILVKGLDALHALVKGKGWTQISDIVSSNWGARECTVTTPDGCLLRFFEEVCGLRYEGGGVRGERTGPAAWTHQPSNLTTSTGQMTE